MTSKDISLRPFDAAEILDDDETIAGYVLEAFESGDPAEIAEAVGTVARARGMTEVARKAGVSRESLYRALSSKGNPELTTLVSVMRACGLQLAVKPAPSPAAKPVSKATRKIHGTMKWRRRRAGARPMAKAS